MATDEIRKMMSLVDLDARSRDASSEEKKALELVKTSIVGFRAHGYWRNDRL